MLGSSDRSSVPSGGPIWDSRTGAGHEISLARNGDCADRPHHLRQPPQRILIRHHRHAKNPISDHLDNRPRADRVRRLFWTWIQAMNKEKIIVLGGGLVGGPMAMDLALEHRFDVTVADLNESALAELQARQPRISVLVEDLSTRATVKDVVDGHDIVAAQPRLCRAKTRPAPPLPRGRWARKSQVPPNVWVAPEWDHWNDPVLSRRTSRARTSTSPTCRPIRSRRRAGCRAGSCRRTP